MREAKPGGDLSNSEHLVLIAVRKLKTNKEIGSLLGISARTVKFHISNILICTGCQDRRDLFKEFGILQG